MLLIRIHPITNETVYIADTHTRKQCHANHEINQHIYSVILICVAYSFYTVPFLIKKTTLCIQSYQFGTTPYPICMHRPRK